MHNDFCCRRAIRSLYDRWYNCEQIPGYLNENLEHKTPLPIGWSYQNLVRLMPPASLRYYWKQQLLKHSKLGALEHFEFNHDVMWRELFDDQDSRNELLAYSLIQELLSNYIDKSRISFRDNLNSVSVLIDNRHVICRLFFSGDKRLLAVPYWKRRHFYYKINSLSDILYANRSLLTQLKIKNLLTPSEFTQS